MTSLRSTPPPLGSLTFLLVLLATLAVSGAFPCPPAAAESAPLLTQGPRSPASVAPRLTILPINQNLAADAPTPPYYYQGEVELAIDPNDASRMVVVANNEQEEWEECQQNAVAVFYTADHGKTWSYTCGPSIDDYAPSSCPPEAVRRSYEPTLAWDLDGSVFLSYTAHCEGTWVQGNYIAAKTALVTAVSQDGGASWEPLGTIEPWRSVSWEHRPSYEIDTRPGSEFDGRHYVCWSAPPETSYDWNSTRISYSDDGGATWTTTRARRPRYDPPKDDKGFPLPYEPVERFCDLSVDADGSLHLIFQQAECRRLSPSSCTDERLFYERSDDGGESWSSPVMLAELNLVASSMDSHPQAQNVRGIHAFGGIEVDLSGSSCEGLIYVVYADSPSIVNRTYTDILLLRSGDGGNSWDGPVTVSDTGAGSPVQFHPALAVDRRRGGPVVAWYDTRNGNGREVDVFAARSLDCGETFEPNLPVTRRSPEFHDSDVSHSVLHRTDGSLRHPHQFGDHLGLAVNDGWTYAAWTDGRHFSDCCLEQEVVEGTCDGSKPICEGEIKAEQRENAAFAGFNFDLCDTGTFEGEWTPPEYTIEGGRPGSLQGTMLDRAGEEQWVIEAEPYPASASAGEILGTLYGTGEETEGQEYPFEGTYTYDLEEEQQIWSGEVILTEAGPGIGSLSGVTESGSVSGRWEICP